MNIGFIALVSSVISAKNGYQLSGFGTG